MAKAFDLIAGIKPDAGAEPVIPPRHHRKHQHAYDKALYKERNVIERFACSLGPMAFTGSLNKLKQCRRVATRYDKLDTCDNCSYSSVMIAVTHFQAGVNDLSEHRQITGIWIDR